MTSKFCQQAANMKEVDLAKFNISLYTVTMPGPSMMKQYTHSVLRWVSSQFQYNYVKKVLCSYVAYPANGGLKVPHYLSAII